MASKWVMGSLAVGGLVIAAGGLWVQATFGRPEPPSVPIQGASAGRPEALPQGLPDAPAPVGQGGGVEIPPDLLLAGTNPDTNPGSAVFMIAGDLHRVSVGARVGATVMVLRRVAPQAAWLSEGPQGPEFVVPVRSPQELARERDAARQIAASPAALAGRSLPDSALRVQGAANGVALPEEMQVRVRRRELHLAGPVGAP